MFKRSLSASASVRSAFVAAVAVTAAAIAGCQKDGTAASGQADRVARSGETTAAKPIPRTPVVQPAVGFQQRAGDEIVVCGQFYRIGTRVVTWMDPGGYDAYRTERRFAKYEVADYEATVQPELTAAAAATQKAERERATRPSDFPSVGPAVRNVITGPNRFGLRYGDSDAFWRAAATRPSLNDAANFDSPTTRPLTREQLEMVRGGGWPLSLLQQKVDQFVVHYDVAGTSRYCFDVLQDDRTLSVQFMLDLDGTIYQTLDVKERAWQATKANSRSIGIEIANMGSYGAEKDPFATWYKKDPQGKTYISIPPRHGGMASQYTNPSDPYALRPIRNDPVIGELWKVGKNGQLRPVRQRQYDLTPQQYEALPHLIAALCDVFPEMTCDYPRNPDGSPLMRTLTDKEYNVYQGVLGHYHVQENKSDPGPAFQWERVMSRAKQLLAERRASVAAKNP